MFGGDYKMGEKKYLKELRQFSIDLRKDFLIDRVIFFGSRASGEEREDSDIDLIIVSDDFESMSFFERVAKMYDYWNLRIPVDFICYTRKEFNSLKKRVSIVKEALEEGIVI